MLDTLKRFNIANRALIPVLIPMFLIISSSIYPAIISSIENKEMLIISNVMAQLRGNDTVDTSVYQAHKQMLSSRITTPSSPTPIDPTFSSASPSKVSSDTPKILSDHSKDLITPYTINAGDLVHVLWEDNTPGNNDILYKRDGADFDPTTINLSNNARSSVNPAIAVSGSNVHVVWTDNTGLSGENFDILYRRSTDGGATFGPTINLSNNAGESDDSAIAVSGNNVHVAWHDDTPGNFDILYRRSANGGASFTDPTKNLSSNVGQSGRPALAVSGNMVHVVWDDLAPGNRDILYRRSIDGGSTFPNVIKNLSNNAGASLNPEIAVSGNNVHVVWEDSTPSDILYRRSLDSGNTFPNVIKNLSSNLGSSFDPSIAVSGNNVHVGWSDDTPGNFDIFYRRSLDSGTTFPNVIKNLSSSGGDSEFPAIALSGNNVYVVWTNFTSGFEILYRTSANNGDTFPAVLTNLSANAGASFNPAIGITNT